MNPVVVDSKMLLNISGLRIAFEQRGHSTEIRLATGAVAWRAKPGQAARSLGAGRLELEDVNDAVRRGGSDLGLSEAEVRAVAAVAVQSPIR